MGRGWVHRKSLAYTEPKRRINAIGIQLVDSSSDVNYFIPCRVYSCVKRYKTLKTLSSLVHLW